TSGSGGSADRRSRDAGGELLDGVPGAVRASGSGDQRCGAAADESHRRASPSAGVSSGTWWRQAGGGLGSTVWSTDSGSRNGDGLVLPGDGGGSTRSVGRGHLRCWDRRTPATGRAG